MNNRSAFFKILLVVLVLVGLSEISFSQNNLYNFPKDSARWYLKVRIPNGSACDLSFIRYSSKGDTTVNGKTYKKIYRQWISDSLQFTESKDTLRMLMRNGVIDSFKVYARFVDSVNEYGTKEFKLMDKYWYQYNDTVVRKITANGLAEDQIMTVGAPRLEGAPQRCSYKSNNDSWLTSSEGYVAEEINWRTLPKCNKSNIVVVGAIGELENGWFATDLDSLALFSFNPYHSFFDNKVCKCKMKTATLYHFETILYSFITKKRDWYEAYIHCLHYYPYTSVDELTNPQKIKVSPNPFSNSFKIEYSESIKSLKLIDAQGKVFLDKNYESGEAEQEVNLEKLKPGIYFLIVNGGYSKKVVKF